MNGPNPNSIYPFAGLSYGPNTKRSIFLKNFITRNNITVGDYTYYDHPAGPENFEKDNLLYHYDFSIEKLIIGKFCGIASNTKFMMTGGHHKMDAFSAYPFGLFGHGWEKENDVFSLPSNGDTIVGNDVWFGYDSLIMPGITIGNGAIIGTRSVVTKDVPHYSIVAGNPAKIIKFRFNEETISEL